MKVCIVQPYYSMDFSRVDELFQWELDTLDKCDESMDLIVFPESSDIPALAPSPTISSETARKFSPVIRAKASETAKRCNAIVIVNGRDFTYGERNTTFVYDRNGNEVFKYYKQHLVPSEVKNIDSIYSFEYEEPYILELEGYRFGFLTCYDFYFYEYCSALARQNLDFIIGCSHQRSDLHSAIETMCRFYAYNTNAFVIRSSISLGEDSEICGNSCVVSPKGETLLALGSKVGFACVDIDPKNKYLKPAGFGNPPSPHYEYIENGRRPMKYRPGGSMIVRNEDTMPYPRVCAHRGFNTVAPENTMPAFGSAIALGTDEIEFDLWPTSDGVVVSCHDNSLERVSDGVGKITDTAYEELLKFDFGVKFGEKFKGLKILTFEEILKKFSCHAIMNIHIKPENAYTGLSEEFIKKIVSLIRKYDCEKFVYFMTSSKEVIALLKKFAPDMPICLGAGQNPWDIVNTAIELGLKKVQLFRPFFNKEMVDKAHQNGIRCNVFWADEEDLAREYLDMGIDCILTNDYLKIAKIVEEYKK